MGRWSSSPGRVAASAPPPPGRSPSEAAVARRRHRRGLGKQTAEACRAIGGGVAVAYCDVADPDAVADLTASVHAEPALDVLVNNAGVGLTGELLGMTFADWQWVRSVNLDGPVLPTSVRAGHDRQRHGHVVNVSSALAYVREPPSRPTSPPSPDSWPCRDRCEPTGADGALACRSSAPVSRTPTSSSTPGSSVVATIQSSGPHRRPVSARSPARQGGGGHHRCRRPGPAGRVRRLGGADGMGAPPCRPCASARLAMVLTDGRRGPRRRASGCRFDGAATTWR